VASQISLLSPTSATPVSGYGTAAGGWTNAAGFSGSVSGGFTIVVYLVGTGVINAGLLGYQIVAIGASGYSGSVPSNSFT